MILTTLIIAVLAASPAAPGSLRVKPAADTYVNSLHPDAANGATPQLRVNGHPRRSKWVYLRFSVAGIPDGAKVTRATLRLLARDNAAGATVAVYHVGRDDWNEKTLAWRGRPAPDATPLDAEKGVAAGRWNEWDVTAGVAGNGEHSFSLGRIEAVNADIDWGSRESAAGTPELVVEFTTPAQAPSR
jgi:hypothetical protein